MSPPFTFKNKGEIIMKELNPIEKINKIKESLQKNGIKLASSGLYASIFKHPSGEGEYKIILTSNCEGSVIGTYSISYVYNDEEYDLDCELICMRDKVEYIVRDILDSISQISINEILGIECPFCHSNDIIDVAPFYTVNGDYISNARECKRCHQYI